MGHVTVVGGCRAKAPSTGILASSLAVGTTVKLMENGTAVEYLVVNNGIPGNSSVYSSSCDGLWLLRKDIRENRAWHSSRINSYSGSSTNTYLNSTFFNLLGSIEQETVKQVKIPYRAGAGYSKTVTGGESGLSVKVFLLSATEIGAISSYSPTNEGSLLSYFESGSSTASSKTKRIAYLNGTASYWWLRSPDCDSDWGMEHSMHVPESGTWGSTACDTSKGIRPALILPNNALFDKNTLLLKGVA